MNDQISPKQFLESEGAAEWRVLGDGGTAYFPTGSFAAGARLVQAICELPGVDEQKPDIDVRHDGVTVRMVSFVEGYGGMTRGHADLAGALKYNFPEARYILERASARESASRVAIGAIAKLFLRELGIEVLSHVIAVGKATLGNAEVPW